METAPLLGAHVKKLTQGALRKQRIGRGGAASALLTANNKEPARCWGGSHETLP